MTEHDLSDFRCLRCGNCCRKHGTVRLNDAESRRIADYLNISIYDFTDRYTALLPDRSALTIAELKNGDCIFYDSKANGCRIQPVKPKQCRDFPYFWRFPGWEKTCAGVADLQKRRRDAIVNNKDVMEKSPSKKTE